MAHPVFQWTIIYWIPADKYDLPQLVLHCIGCLEKNLSVSTAFATLVQAKLYKDSQASTKEKFAELERKSLSHIEEQPLEALKDIELMAANIQLLIELSKRDTLCIDEYDLLQIMLASADKRCQMEGKD